MNDGETLLKVKTGKETCKFQRCICIFMLPLYIKTDDDQTFGHEKEYLLLDIIALAPNF